VAVVLTLVQLSLGGSSPYTSTYKRNKNKIYINETIQKHSATIHKAVHTSIHITSTHTHYKMHTYPHPQIRNELK
jgi:hypothetical protein